MSRFAKAIHLAAVAWPWLLVTVFGVWLLWPIPSGVMPLSADHTVHLTRIWMWTEGLRDGALHAWSPHWAFGVPTGDLYPVLGDLVVVLLQSFGLLNATHAYALGVSLVFLVQGWAMLGAGRALRLGPWPGLVAALLLLTDAGQYREGGWIYTMGYGVWPQVFATALGWWGLGAVVSAWQRSPDAGAPWRRALVWAGLLWGAALLAHPMSLVHIAMASVLALVVLGRFRVESTRRAFATVAFAGVVAFGIAAWWLLPMLQYKGWMASYGWLGPSMARMSERLLAGLWFDNGAPFVGFVIAGGLVLCALVGSRPARLYAVLALCLWVFTSADVLVTLRLDRLSEGFTHIQYQRMLIAAKPGLYLVAGTLIGMLVRAGTTLWSRGLWRRLAASTAFVAALGLCVGMGMAQLEVAKRQGVGRIQQTRIPGAPDFDDDYARWLDWLRARWDERTDFFRVTVDDHRNTHWFVDATAHTGVPIFKQGFTPGDNFVHKPESGSPLLLDRACARYEARRRAPGRTQNVVARFGTIEVIERMNAPCQTAWLDGPGALEMLEANWFESAFEVRVRGAEPRSRLVFAIAGYPRWELRGPDGPVPWFEVPVLGSEPTATPEDRAAGLLRGGKARGDDGTEPTLLAAEVGDGTYTLTYRRWTAIDVLGLLLTLATLGFVIAWPLSARRSGLIHSGMQRVHATLQRLGHPKLLAVLAAVMLLGALAKWHAAADARAAWASMRIDEDDAVQTNGLASGLLKTDMLIRPALVPTRRGDVDITFAGVVMDERLEGWVAIDDDAGQMPRRGRYRLYVDVRQAPSEPWQTLVTHDVRHVPGRQPLAIDTATLAGETVVVRVRVETVDRPPPMGFDLELGAPP